MSDLPKCQSCTETQGLKACYTCGVLICAAHRWSTGNPDDGYYCTDSLCVPVHKTVLSIPPWMKEDSRFNEALAAPAKPSPWQSLWDLASTLKNLKAVYRRRR